MTSSFYCIYLLTKNAAKETQFKCNQCIWYLIESLVLNINICNSNSCCQCLDQIEERKLWAHTCLPNRERLIFIYKVYIYFPCFVLWIFLCASVYSCIWHIKWNRLKDVTCFLKQKRILKYVSKLRKKMNCVRINFLAFCNVGWGRKNVL